MGRNASHGWRRYFALPSVRIVLDLQGAQSGSRFRGVGRYSLALAEAIAREAGHHDVWLALSGRFPNSIERLCAKFATLIPPEQIRVFELPGPVAEVDLANTWRKEAAELLREKFLADLCPDVVHVSTLFEGLADEAVNSVGRLDARVPTAVTLYDLIPLLRPDDYLRKPVVKRCYLRRLQSLKRADLLLAISESSRREAIEALQILPERIVTIGAGLPRSFHGSEASHEAQEMPTARYGLRRPFVLYTGGDDPRKNLEGLIAAFALLPDHIRRAYQLAIVCNLPEETHRKLAAVAKKHGLDDDLVCPGHVPDEDLRLLYAKCSVFVFPSLHEGFGLPILEAMACGAPVIASNCTSIPEIINRTDALFDPLDPRDISIRMAQVLSNPELRQNLKEWGRDRAKMFTWEASARKALRAFEALHAERKAARAGALHITKRRPLLAFVAPLPPARTGIARYSAKLLPNLARHYQIVCIADQPEVTDPWITAEFVIRDGRWFEENAGSFDRILYQFGDSPSHKQMFGFLERHPGVAVLHDFYLSGVVNWMEDSGYAPDSFIKALYDSHGFSALEKDRLEGRAASVKAFPCNAAVLRGSIGVIVHSNHSIELARAWYGDRISSRIRHVPFLPCPPEAIDRGAARKRLCLPENAFVLCSFSQIAPEKLDDRLLEAWLASPSAQDEACFLIFVGENFEDVDGKQLMDRIAGSGVASRIRLAGYFEESRYRDYVAAADLGVQLRSGSRGETSGRIFDCLSRSVPLLINAHGSAAELPDDVVMKLDDDFTDEALCAALERLRRDMHLRQNLAARGALHLRRAHHPERIAEQYREIIEDIYSTSSQAREQHLVQAIARISAPTGATKADLAAVAVALAANRDWFGLPRILVDVTNLAKSDFCNGTERVTRAILTTLIADPPPGYRIEPVRAVTGGYLYARRLASECLGLPQKDLVDDPVETHRGDIFIGMDWCADVAPMKPWFLEQRRHGARIAFVVHDLLPLFRPEYFPPRLVQMTVDWIQTVAEVADSVACVSRTVADELYKWLAEAKPQRLRPLPLGFFHPGADLHARAPTTGLPEDASAMLTKLRSRPSFLMVGTVEPRRGYQQALAAMEQLWAEGVDVNLVIIGEQGLKTDDLAQRIRHHPERDNRLLWLQGISGETLEQLYRGARALLAASEHEGFGLSLIEAAQHGLPIIARDISVFREVGGGHAYYFRGNEPQELADALRAWLSLGDDAPPSTNLERLTWQQSSRQLLDVALGKCWCHCWSEAKPCSPVLDDSAAQTSTSAISA
jgi:glycosyltransferase involved in cell wall biosynthesis